MVDKQQVEASALAAAIENAIEELNNRIRTLPWAVVPGFGVSHCVDETAVLLSIGKLPVGRAAGPARGRSGFPCVEDPRDFSPDVECCSPAEIESHRLAMANYGKPAYQPNNGCFTEHDESGQMVRHVLRTSWGIGVNLVERCDGCNVPPFGEPMVTCHECGGWMEFCPECWREHERKHEDGEI